MSAKVKFYNLSDDDTVLGSFGITHQATYRQSYSDRQRRVRDLVPGSRLFIAWDEFTEDILAFQETLLEDGKKYKAKFKNNTWTFAIVTTFNDPNDPDDN